MPTALASLPTLPPASPQLVQQVRALELLARFAQRQREIDAVVHAPARHRSRRGTRAERLLDFLERRHRGALPRISRRCTRLRSSRRLPGQV